MLGLADGVEARQNLTVGVRGKVRTDLPTTAIRE